MSNKLEHPTIFSAIWREEPEADNPFAARTAYCRGYDVYGDMLGKARWVDMLYLLFQKEAPSPAQADLLEAVAIALANPGPRDASVHAAMCGGASGSPAAASLIAALSVSAGQFSGGREIYSCMERWSSCGTSLDAWKENLLRPVDVRGTIWPESQHVPGFDPYGATTAKPVLQTLACVEAYCVGAHLSWLKQNYAAMEAVVGYPLALSGVVAAAFADLGFSAAQAEMMHLLLRLPGAAAHALEQNAMGYKKFPFGTIKLQTESPLE